ncbi:hypothetical protein [Reichenbachiella versicolor]|uniref:hypothetical protein n=1 Tax=Reichenbachiella versicolor TaxID=1821036 RepID=UPI000D6E99B3|nr:hypothetical protein [Reichenbachiella versicolor]
MITKIKSCLNLTFLSLILSLTIVTSSCDTAEDKLDEATQNGEEGEGNSEDDSSSEDENGESSGNDEDDSKASSIKYGEDFIVFEPQVTDSELGNWVYRKKGDPEYFDGSPLAPINDDYFEFEGNKSRGGKEDSPLVFKFTAPKSGNFYFAARLLQNFEEGDHDDYCNDIYVKMEGDFTSATDFTTDQLKIFHKFYGRGNNKPLANRALGTMRNLEIKGKHALAIYNFKEGEEYTLTIAGRSKNACIDYFLFHHESLKLNRNISKVKKADMAEVLPEEYRPDTK